ncbi:hypothetical protein Pmar_PMAR003228 [Perkinsus marinus ATCC 50983]|uniref:Uncharacterized protein n=1 Tax=Perkinsus marinus (strain ATCC 50983 / TXsc) TaxID=423536 RepID=C5LKI8_PERM5|nr:hypothetical protein Pmar_PMAR003228 [Perkinsus marinus ATCC 50983]EER02755.1 hypothetical protein Pmar_PMAR003228 [Perkinsus marinus ATCC 50983]|eukprot:XP_002770939.1 hypothetical protein Pmar_PMAR003228 [Perkinsus marinus ATCC 50983]
MLKAAVDDAELLGEMVDACAVAMGATEKSKTEKKPPNTFEQWLPLMLRWAFTIYVLEGKGDLIHVCE